MDARTLAGKALVDALRDSRARLLERVLDLDDAHWLMPRQRGVNPIAWELGHVAWFAEFWMLRGPHHVDERGFVRAARPARLAGPDDVFDSARLAHAGRWEVTLPPRQALLERLAAQLDACCAAVPASADADVDADDAALYFPRLVLFHEDMHAEAFAWLRAALGHAPPPGCESLPCFDAGGPLRIAGGTARIGRPREQRGFAFDNEMPARRPALADFEIDAAPVTAGQFAAFVAAGGPRPERWREAEGGRWQVRWFDRWQDLDPRQPVIHVNAAEAEAYCRWTGRRLPSAAQWEHAATVAGGAFHWGRSVWEWTADPFEPYEGFEPGPYRDYSAPWFTSHRELRGGAFATHARLHDARYRNFFEPHRRDVFAGFRTAAA